MSYLRWTDRRKLQRPVLLVALEGWTDAGEAASTAARFLADAVRAAPVATIDPEEFYDFTVARPTVRVDGALDRHIEWPSPTVSAASVPSIGRDLVLLVGVEPALKWRTFSEEVLALCREVGVETAFLLGSLLADVPHTRMPRVAGYTTSAELTEQFGFGRSRYEGPTGVLGVLSDTLSRAGLRCASLWTSAPHYLRDTQSPKAALAMVERVGDLLGLHVDVTALEIASAAYERHVEDVLAGESEVAEYVRQLEDEEPDEERSVPRLPAAETIAAEVERYLRDQRGGNA